MIQLLFKPSKTLLKPSELWNFTPGEALNNLVQYQTYRWRNWGKEGRNCRERRHLSSDACLKVCHNIGMIRTRKLLPLRSWLTETFFSSQIIIIQRKLQKVYRSAHALYIYPVSSNSNIFHKYSKISKTVNWWYKSHNLFRFHQFWEEFIWDILCHFVLCITMIIKGRTVHHRDPWCHTFTPLTCSPTL